MFNVRNHDLLLLYHEWRVVSLRAIHILMDEASLFVVACLKHIITIIIFLQLPVSALQPGTWNEGVLPTLTRLKKGLHFFFSPEYLIFDIFYTASACNSRMKKKSARPIWRFAHACVNFKGIVNVFTLKKIWATCYQCLW